MKAINKILVPIDFSEISERILPLALFVAEKFAAELHVIFVAEDIFTYSGYTMGDFPMVQFEEDNLANSKKRLEDFLEKYRSGSRIPMQNKVLQGQVAREIVDYSKAQDIDLIVMGTHGYRGLEKMFMGSVTDRVLKLASCPVLSTK
jgi:nucleotide-binding universal stress UspA family protein